MRTGLFFETDGEPISGKGNVYFTYLALKSPHDYPISLRITDNSLEFQFIEDIQSARDDSRQHEYKECLVLRVPLDLSLHPELSVNPILGRKDIGFDVGDLYSFDKKFDIINSYRESVDLSTNNDKNKKQSELLHHLLMDFLYDFVHSDVFSILPNYKHIKELIYRDVFLYALISKCEFHYQLNEFIDKYKESERENHEAKILARLLYSSEQKWLSIIHDKKYEEVFSIESIWFKNIEDEYSDVLFQSKKAEYKRKIWYGILTKKSSSDTENIVKTDYKKRDPNDSQFSQIRRHNEVIIRMSAQWYLGRYNFGRALSCLSLILPGKNKYIFPIVAFITALIVVGAPIWYPVKEVIPPTLGQLDQVSVELMRISSIIIVLAMIVVLTYCVCARSFRMLYLMLMPRLTIGLISAWVLLLTSESFMMIFNDNYFGCTMLIMLILSGIFMFLCHIMVLNSQIPNHRIKKRRCLAKRVLVLSIIAYIYTFVIGVILTNSIYPIMLKNGIVRNEFKQAENNLLVEPPKGCSPGVEYIRSYIINTTTVTANSLSSIATPHYTPDSTKLVTSGNDLFSKFRKKINVPLFGEIEYHEVLVVRYSLFGSILLFPIILTTASFATVFLGVFIELLVHNKPIIEPINPLDISKVDI